MTEREFIDELNRATDLSARGMFGTPEAIKNLLGINEAQLVELIKGGNLEVINWVDAAGNPDGQSIRIP